MQNTGERKNDDVKNLETITVPQSYTEGVNPNFVMIDAREFRYNGMMYDIVERKEQGDSITYVCVRDSKEEKMLGHFAKKSNTGTANVRGGLLLLPMFIVSNEFYTMTVYPPYSEKSGRYTFLSHSPLFIDYDVPTPPPKNEIYSDRIS